MKPMKEIMASLPSIQLIVAMFITTMLVQSATMSIDPIVSLYVKSMMPGSKNVALIAGIVGNATSTMIIIQRLAIKWTKLDLQGIAARLNYWRHLICTHGSY